MAALIKMKRDDGKEADVHPDMVAEYAAGGFSVVETPKPKAKAVKK